MSDGLRIYLSSSSTSTSHRGGRHSTCAKVSPEPPLSLKLVRTSSSPPQYVLILIVFDPSVAPFAHRLSVLTCPESDVGCGSPEETFALVIEPSFMPPPSPVNFHVPFQVEPDFVASKVPFVFTVLPSLHL